MRTTEEMIAVMTAYEDGKKIQILGLHDEGWIDWVLKDAPTWDWCNYDYRVKPEPYYRPYANAEECFADVQKHGVWVKNTSGQYLHILALGKDSMAYADNISFPYERACHFLVWADDGSPCGVKEE